MTDFAELDDAAIEQLLAGEIAAGDAPDGWAPVALLLRAAAEVEPGDDPEPELLAAMVAAAGQSWSRSDGGGVVARRRIGVAVGVAAMFLGAGTAAAAAGGYLPDPVQAVVHDIAEAAGIDVPDADEVDDDDTDDTGDEQGPPSTAGSQDGEGHGRSDEAPGRPADPGRPTDPGRSDEAPGRPASPGNAENAPGQDGTTGRPESPGQSDVDHGAPADPGQPGLPPGQSNRPTTTTTATTAPPAPTAPVEEPGNGNAGGNGNGNANGSDNGNAGGNGNANAGGNGNGNGN